MYNPTETPTKAFTPFDWKQYTEWFLVPHIATALIAEDRDCSHETAYQEMIASGDVGESLQQEDDGDEMMNEALRKIFLGKEGLKGGGGSDKGMATTAIPVSIFIIVVSRSLMI
jgi:hypothetical protein